MKEERKAESIPKKKKKNKNTANNSRSVSC